MSTSVTSKSSKSSSSKSSKITRSAHKTSYLFAKGYKENLFQIQAVNDSHLRPVYNVTRHRSYKRPCSTAKLNVSLYDSVGKPGHGVFATLTGDRITTRSLCETKSVVKHDFSLETVDFKHAYRVIDNETGQCIGKWKQSKSSPFTWYLTTINNSSHGDKTVLAKYKESDSSEGGSSSVDIFDSISSLALNNSSSNSLSSVSSAPTNSNNSKNIKPLNRCGSSLSFESDEVCDVDVQMSDIVLLSCISLRVNLAMPSNVADSSSLSQTKPILSSLHPALSASDSYLVHPLVRSTTLVKSLLHMKSS